VLESTQLHLTIMTLSRTGTEYLTTEEWNEMDILRKAMNYSLASVHPEKQERFTELFVKSLRGKGDQRIN
jgi:hypothetical protein